MSFKPKSKKPSPKQKPAFGRQDAPRTPNMPMATPAVAQALPKAAGPPMPSLTAPMPVMPTNVQKKRAGV